MIYLDSNASHPLLPVVRERLARAIVNQDERLANPSSIHRKGQVAKMEMAELRDDLCKFLGRPDGDEFIFLSGATEAINLAMRGFVRERQDSGRKAALIVSSVEHSAVLDTARDLAGDPISAEIIAVNSHGQIEFADLEARIARLLADPAQDVLLCLQLVNNETGVAFDTDEVLQKITAQFAPVPQTHLPRIKGNKFPLGPQRLFVLIDAAQALGKMDDSQVRRALHLADYFTLSAHKIGGPSGVGALWLRKGVPFRPQMTGGVQERKRRAGTANTLGLYGFHLALTEWMQNGEEWRAQMAVLRQLAALELMQIEGLVIHGLSPTGELPRLANTLNFHVEGCPEESLLLALDLAGFCVSSGSACNSGSLRPSHVLKAMGYSDEVALSSIRMTLGVENTRDQVLAFTACVKAMVAQIRTARAYSRTIFADEFATPDTKQDTAPATPGGRQILNDKKALESRDSGL